MEAPSSADPRGTAGVGHTTARSGGERRRFATTPHQVSGGIDRHARSLYGCILNQDGDIMRHRHLQAGPEP